MHADARAGAETPPPVCVELPQPENTITEELDKGLFRTRLASGTEVWTERMESMRSAAVGFWFRSGSAHEPDDMLGSAHMLEHMVFKGTTRRTAHQIASEIEDLGGSLDAYTAHEHTAYLGRVPDTHLATIVDVLSDLAFHPRLDPADLVLEREVVLEEIARSEDTPDDLVFDLHAEFLYAGHVYGRPILGNTESVSEMDVEALRGLHAKTCHPSNLVVAAAGRLEHEEFLEQVVERLPGDVEAAGASIEPPVNLGSGLLRVSRPSGRQTHIVAGGAGVSVGDPLRHAVILVGTVLGGGMGSRLFQRIREEMGLAYAVYEFRAFYLQAGHIGAYVGTRPETADRAREALMAELRKLADEGLTTEELETTRIQLKGQVVLSLESPGSRMYRLASLALAGEPYRSLDQVMDLIDGVTESDAAQAASLYDPDGLAVLELSPA